MQQSMVSVTKVEATGDLRYAKVYISVLDKDKARESPQGPQVRRRLPPAGRIAARLQLRYTPELVFVEDDSIAYGARMFDLLKSLDIREDESHDEET